MIKPKPLKHGDVVGVIAPSGPPDSQEDVQRGLQVLRDLGLSYRLGQSVSARRGYLAGSDEIRSSDVMDMFLDPTIDGIFCLRGGWGALRFLDSLDYQAIGANPKIFVGYSDITSLHVAFNQKSNLVTFHGPMVFEYSKTPPLPMKFLQRAVFENDPMGTYFPDDENYTIVPGKAEGNVVGGNLCLLVASLGTEYEIDTTGKVLFIEDIGEEPYRMDRMLTQLKLAGKLESAAAIVVGTCVDCGPKLERKSLSLKEVLFDHLVPAGVPSYYGLPVGHGQQNLTLPLGVRVAVDAEFRQLEAVEKATRKI